MKIALCLSGQPRALDVGYSHLYREFLSKYSVDTFCHIWFDPKLDGMPFSYNIIYPGRNEMWRDDLDKTMLQMYNPKMYTFEQPKVFPFDSKANYEMSKSNNCSMFYSIQRSNDLKIEYERLHNFKYDLVIRSRTDITIANCKLDLNTLDTRKIYTSTTHQRFSDGTEICNDQLAIGSSSLMDAYSCLYSLLNFYWERDTPPSMVGERVLTHHLRNCNIPVKCCTQEVLFNDIYKG
jgi:hypothetical protein